MAVDPVTGSRYIRAVLQVFSAIGASTFLKPTKQKSRRTSIQIRP